MVWDYLSGEEVGNFKSAAIQAIYMKNNHEGILIGQSGNLYGITLDNKELNITWVVAGASPQGGSEIQPINQAPLREQSFKEQAEKTMEPQGAIHNNQVLLSPAL